MADTYDVTVRIPVAFESAAEMAGFIERAVVNAMTERDWTGGAFVIFRADDGEFVGFLDGQGGEKPYGGVLPHGLVEPDARASGVPSPETEAT